MTGNNDYFGGDLEGIRSKLDYLEKLEDDVKEKLTKAIEECKSKFLSEH